MVELVDTMDLKSIRPKGRCRFDSITEYNKPEVQGNEHAGYVETSQYTSKLSPVRNRWSGSVIPSYW